MARFNLDDIRRDHPISDVAARLGIQLTRNGREWQAICPLPGHAERTASWQIFTGKDGLQRYHCKGCGEFGDVVDFVQEVCGLSFVPACEMLTGGAAAPAKPRSSNGNGHHAPDPYAGYTVTLPPPDAPVLAAGVQTPPLRNPKRSRDTRYTPTLVHPYLNADGDLTGYVLRVDIGDGRKFTPSILWMTHTDGWAGWSHGSMPEPRPIYGGHKLATTPTRQVLIVEGEKCADAAAIALDGRITVVSWCGGGKAWRKTDWAALAGRRCVLWPDADQQGRQTMDALAAFLSGLGATVRQIDPEPDRPAGWDVADAIAGGWDPARTIEYAKVRARDWIGPQKEEVMQSESSNNQSFDARPHPDSPPTTDGATALDTDPTPEPPPHRPSRDNITSLHGDPIPPPSEDADWQAQMITDENGKAKPRLASNFHWLLRGHADTRGIFWWNDIMQGVFLLAAPPWDKRDQWRMRALTNSDILNTNMWLERCGMQPRKSESLDGIKSVAGRYRFNPIRDYLNGLKWDGVPRLLGGGTPEGDSIQPLAQEYLGSPSLPIYSTFVTKWHVGAVARALNPGCVMKTMLILEGPQNKLKSTYLRKMATIGDHEYFADSIGDITQPGSIMLLQGTWIIEVSELAGFDRREVNHIKAWLSRVTDRYVPKFESEPREIPRPFVVAGTHNPSGHGYLKDPTGAVRFWPLPVGEIALDRIECDRDQIWAEAMTLYRSGMKWWLTAEEDAAADTLTADRRVEDPWGSKIDEITNGLMQVSMSALLSGLGVPVSQQTEITTKRISEYLKGNGFARSGNGQSRIWRRNGAGELPLTDGQ